MKNSPWLDAFIDPAGLLLLVSSVISGLISAWWMFPVGLLLWVILVIVILRDPSLRINQAIQNRSELSQRFQKPFDRIQKSQVSFFNSVQSSDNQIRNRLMPLNNAMEQLLDAIYEECKRYSILENYRVVSSSIDGLQEELKSISSKIQSVGNSELLPELESAQKSIQEKISKQQSTIDQLDRFSTELNTIQSDLDGIIADAIQTQSMGVDELKKVIPSLIKKTETIKQKLLD